MRNVKVSNKPEHRYAATTPVQVEFTNNSHIECKNDPVNKSTPAGYYTTINNISDEITIYPSARKKIHHVRHLENFYSIYMIIGFRVAVENVQYLNRGANKGQEIRALQIRDDTIEESRTMILRGPAVHCTAIE